ncbi:MAG: ankyrin repeat domain-containing protein, partial [Arenicellales bacterium]
DHANSHVLIGYVYTHQGRYKEAEEAFKKANQIGTDNLWLWANWGQLLLKQGQVERSIAMYSKGIEGERPYNTYDRARIMAYRHLIKMYRLNNDIEKVDELHLKRIAEFGNESCFPYHYAKFRQRNFDDADITLKYARKALDSSCQYEAGVRKVIGTAYYAKWIATPASDESQSYLTQARLFFPEGPELIFWLAQAEKTIPVIKRLVDDGISIDVVDNRGLTALAYAAKEDDFEALKRLIDMGGNPNTTVGKEKLPLLAVAVLSQNKDAVRYLVTSGADVNAQVSEGASLLDLAEGMGFGDIAEVLKNAGGTRI